MAATSRAMVCGLGASGVAAARLLRAEGADVLAVDERATPESRRSAAALEALGCAVALGASALNCRRARAMRASSEPGCNCCAALINDKARAGLPSRR